MNKRILYFDILRIIAIYGVIMIHVTAIKWYPIEINYNWITNNIMNSLVHSWAVPIFLSVSGALLLNHIDFTFKNMHKFMIRIIICLVFWHVIYYFYRYRTFDIQNIIICFKNLIKGQSHFHLWYMYLMIGLYLLTLILKKVVNVLNKKELFYLLFLIGFYSCILPTIELITQKDLKFLIEPYYVLNTSSMLFYFLLGYYLDKYNIKNLKLVVIFSILFTLVFLSLNIYRIYYSNISISYFKTNSIPGVLLTISIFSIVKKYYQNKENRTFTKLGMLTFGVYLIHYLILSLLIEFNINTYIINPIIGSIINSLVVMIISYTIIYVLSKIPIVKKLIM